MPKTDNSTQICFRSHSLKQKLNDRGDVMSAVAKRDLERYYYLIWFHFVQRFKKAELRLICDICRNLNKIKHDFRYELPGNAFFSYQDTTLDANERLVLLEKVQKLEAAEAIALTDAIERYWLATGRAGWMQSDEVFNEIFGGIIND